MTALRTASLTPLARRKIPFNQPALQPAPTKPFGELPEPPVGKPPAPANTLITGGISLKKPFSKLEKPFYKLEKPFSKLKKPFYKLKKPVKKSLTGAGAPRTGVKNPPPPKRAPAALANRKRSGVSDASHRER
jgi:hypothetical protein